MENLYNGSRLTAHGEIAPSHDLTENSVFTPDNSNLNSNSNSNSNSKLKKLSVIIPAYNVEKFLRKCVDSVVNQTYKNIEIIIIDDGSKDSTPQICEELKDKYENIIVVHQENQGLCRTRGVGVKTSTGDYIAFVDSDDYIDVTAYEKAIKVLEENNCDMVQFGCCIVDMDGNTILEKHREILTINNTRDAFLYFFNDPNDALWTKVYKRHMFDDIEWLKITMEEDYCLSPQLFAKIRKFMTIDELFYYYVQNPESVCHQLYTNKLKRDDADKAEDFVINFTEKNFPEFLLVALWHKLAYCQNIFFDYMFSNCSDRDEVIKQLCNNMRKYYKRFCYELKKSGRNINARQECTYLQRSCTLKARRRCFLLAYFPNFSIFALKIRLKIHALTGI